ncbi:vomeronasal type-2 receptor 26-like [Ranitomeya variabilis]|uniref:vomeronasal type-2 receptor 26-like n=1 Tax=Ranitomeya variabilis TaxID=490064 RepID=UPI004055CF1D
MSVRSIKHKSCIIGHMYKSQNIPPVVHGVIAIISVSYNTKTYTLICEYGFTFSINKSKFVPLTFQWLQSLLLAVTEINKSDHLLPNVTLGVHLFDSCASPGRALEGASWLLTGSGHSSTPNFRCQSKSTPLGGVIGDSSSASSLVLARLLGLYSYPQILHSLRSVYFTTSDDQEIHFDSNGDFPAVYDIVNWQIGPRGDVQQVKVGSYDGNPKQGNKVVVNTSAILWTRRQNQIPVSICSHSCPQGFRKVTIPGKPVCCFQCVQCPPGDITNQTDSIDCFQCPWDQWPNVLQNQCIPKALEFLSFEEPLGATLVATSITSSTIPVALLGLFIYCKTTPIVRANNYSISCLLLLSITLCFLCSLTFIGYPQPGKCLLRQVAFGMVFSLCISCILAKTITVVIAFKATKPDSGLRKWTGTKTSYFVIGLGVIIQLCICVMWLSLSPPFPDHDIISHPGIINVNCNEGSTTAFWCMIGYLGLLATISFVLAFLARRLPDSFNEAKFITFSLLAFLSVWVSFIPAYLSAQGKYTSAMEVFAILSSSWALVICIFMPKCFIILFRPEQNTKDNLMGKVKK